MPLECILVLTCMVSALCTCPRLTFLDIGENRIGRRGADAVAQLLNEHEGLATLCLAKCEVGDHCATLLNAMARHKGLTTVDLSRNGIGDMVLRGALLFVYQLE